MSSAMDLSATLFTNFSDVSVAFMKDFAFIIKEFTKSSTTDLDLPLLIKSVQFPVTATTGMVLILITGIWKLRKNFSGKGHTFEHDVDVSGQRLLELLKTAYKPGHARLVKDQIRKQRINVNENASGSGLTYFLCGCLSGQADLIAFMLERGADIHAETVDGDSPLYLATYAVLNTATCDLNCLQTLIRAGCSVNKQNKGGYTPLHRAASKGNKAVIKFLMDNGADPYIANRAGVYPIDCAICAGHVEAAKLLEINFPSSYVWDVVEPHTPLSIKLGLQSPQRNLLQESSKPRVFRKVLT